jgi:hypothetical protein
MKRFQRGQVGNTWVILGVIGIVLIVLLVVHAI